MYMKTKLWFILPLFGLIFAACEKEEAMIDDDTLKRGGPPAHANAGGQNNNNIVGDEPGCIIDIENGKAETPLLAGQHYEVGTVIVEFDGDSINVTYEISRDDWFITETHLHVAVEKEDIPVNNSGNPMIGLFEYGDDDLFTNEISYTIAKSDIDPDYDGDCYYVAAHAVVVNISEEGDYISLEAFANNLPEETNLGIIQGPVNGGSAYFPQVSLSNSTIEGDYPAWCIEKQVYIYPNELMDADVYSSYDMDNISALVDHPENFPKVNWLLNQNFVGKESDCDQDSQGGTVYTYGDVQIAIWILLFEGDDIPGSVGVYSECRIDKLIELAENHSDFVPGCGEVIAVVLVPEFDGSPRQNIIIEYPFPCYKGETAWGEGCRFVERGNWGMYFKVCNID